LTSESYSAGQDISTFERQVCDWYNICLLYTVNS